MKEVTLKIPENKYQFVLELLHQLGLSVSTNSNDQNFEIPEWQKKIVLDRIKNAKASDFEDADLMLKRIEHKL